MKCPMKFNNPCADADDQCDPECAWRIELLNGRIACAVAVMVWPERAERSVKCERGE